MHEVSTSQTLSARILMFKQVYVGNDGMSIIRLCILLCFFSSESLLD